MRFPCDDGGAQDAGDKMKTIRVSVKVSDGLEETKASVTGGYQVK
jgi:hypothetical protein